MVFENFYRQNVWYYWCKTAQCFRKHLQKLTLYFKFDDVLHIALQKAGCFTPAAQEASLVLGRRNEPEDAFGDVAVIPSGKEDFNDYWKSKPKHAQHYCSCSLLIYISNYDSYLFQCIVRMANLFTIFWKKRIKKQDTFFWKNGGWNSNIIFIIVVGVRNFGSIAIFFRDLPINLCSPLLITEKKGWVTRKRCIYVLIFIVVYILYSLLYIIYIYAYI